ncbi:hypothetical protein [Lacticaseibacillus jixiensis]|uniref:hypothetical protein n=1 Tax=Lacticaseibacillus jixiensis TaxID=3231926 RepID=UPI0036F4216B
MKRLQIQLTRARYCAHLDGRDEAAVAALLQTLHKVGQCHNELNAHLAQGQSLEERLLLVRQWAISHQSNRLRMHAEAVLNVVDSYHLDARLSK